MTRRTILGSRFVGVLAAMLLVTGCFGQAKPTPEIHRTSFEKEWETVRVDSIGVDIDLPKQPWFGPSRYDRGGDWPDHCSIYMHRFLYPGTSEAGSALRVTIRRYSASDYKDILKRNNGKLESGVGGWETKEIFSKIQEQHPGKRTWEFLKCYKAPEGDVVVARCSYGLNDERDVKAIKRMINSVKPYR